ncbi:tetratricopeptide repeat protein [Microcoleus sp. D3_18_C4]|uniref:tetratricopeptide repeat protein n=1 Tax=Microcoleus sp. D3_18_C4 TaxID=3055335 RepID=UPI002FD2CD1A
MIKIDKNTKGVAMFDRAQWFLTGMLLELSVQLSQPVAAVPVGKVVQTAQTNSSNAAETALEEGIQLYQQGTAEALRGAFTKWEEALKLYRRAGNNRGQAFSLLGLGRVYNDLGEKQKALEYFSQSLPLSQAVGDRTPQSLEPNFSQKRDHLHPLLDTQIAAFVDRVGASPRSVQVRELGDRWGSSGYEEDLFFHAPCGNATASDDRVCGYSRAGASD